MDVPALTRRGRGALGLKEMGMMLSRLRATELGGIGMLAERECRVDMMMRYCPFARPTLQEWLQNGSQIGVRESKTGKDMIRWVRRRRSYCRVFRGGRVALRT